LGKYLVKRFLSLALILAGVSVIVFLMVYLMPGTPADINRILIMAPPEQQEAILARTDLNDPVFVKYARWVGNLLRGNLGYSSSYRVPVTSLVFMSLKNTLLLTVISLLFVIAINIPLGVLAAVRNRSVFDYVLSVATFIMFSTPAFFLSLILIRVFSVELSWFPVSGLSSAGAFLTGWAHVKDVARHLAMPVVVMMTGSVAVNLFKRTRVAIIEELKQNYCRAARARGLSRRAVVWRHAFRNSLKPVITLVCLQIPHLFSGALVVENVFAWPGIGKLNFDATVNRDYPLIMGIVLVVVIVTLLANFLADMLYLVVDPRIRLGESGGAKEASA
jgi:peptide/nickel transport system permease protein